jgi:hypothetical protein
LGGYSGGLNQPSGGQVVNVGSGGNIYVPYNTTGGSQCLPSPACLACIASSCDSAAIATFGTAYKTGNYRGGVCPNVMACACPTESSSGKMDGCVEQSGAICIAAFTSLMVCMNNSSCGDACGINGGDSGSEKSNLSINKNSIDFGASEINKTNNSESSCVMVAGNNVASNFSEHPPQINETSAGFYGGSFALFPNFVCDTPSSCKVCVTFLPTTIGLKTATLEIASGLSVSVRGVGIQTPLVGTGGAISFGGNISNGGAVSTGGNIGIGGTTVPIGTGGSISGPVVDTVTFLNGEATGVMKGWGWISSGIPDVVTDPLCNGMIINNATSCSVKPSWNAPNALCMSGLIPALPPIPTQADYDSNWGMEIGISSGGNPSFPIGKSYRTVALSITGLPATGLRVQLHRYGDPDGKTYCAPYVNAPIPLAYFNTKCWDGSGVQLTPEDVPFITDVMLYVYSQTNIPITVSNLCVTKVTFSE